MLAANLLKCFDTIGGSFPGGAMMEQTNRRVILFSLAKINIP